MPILGQCEYFDIILGFSETALVEQCLQYGVVIIIWRTSWRNHVGTIGCIWSHKMASYCLVVMWPCRAINGPNGCKNTENTFRSSMLSRGQKAKGGASTGFLQTLTHSNVMKMRLSRPNYPFLFLFFMRPRFVNKLCYSSGCIGLQIVSG